MTSDPGMPTLAGVRSAAERIAAYLKPTPLYRYPAIDRIVGTEVWVKHENHQPVGAFKVRGGVNLVAQMNEQERARGVIAASTGNHGQSVAYASRLFGVEARVCVPKGANPAKVQAMEDMGATVIFHGPDFDAAREHCEALAAKHGYRYIHSGNEPHLVEGVGTYTLEILAEQPDIDTVIVPIGGGSGASGACIAGKGIKPELTVIGVQAAAAPAAYHSWKSQSLVTDEMNTAAEGLATRTPFELPQRILWDMLDDFVLVTEEEIAEATLTMIGETRNLIEGAAASSLAGALKLNDRLASKKVAIIASGGNITLDQLRALLSR